MNDIDDNDDDLDFYESVEARLASIADLWEKYKTSDDLDERMFEGTDSETSRGSNLLFTMAIHIRTLSWRVEKEAEDRS